MSNVSMIDGHIDEPKMTDENIIRALECCVEEEIKSCSKCPLATRKRCVNKLRRECLKLINRQQAEIDILIRKKEALRDEIAEQQAEIEELKIKLKAKEV